jgi:hypothetical protein
MKSARKEKRIDLGSLIAALYDEVRKITRNKRLQTILVYIALRDLGAPARIN